jgi:hypothetical protein
MRVTGKTGISDLTARLATLEQIETEPLRAEWLRLYRTAPPPRLSRDLLIRGIAHRLQEATYGGLRAAARRKLASTTAEFDGAKNARAAVALQPGAMLVRSWHGQTYTVQVLADGFEHQGQRYRSLSQIAKTITGAHWSGPRFFGLNATAEERVDEAA